MAESIRSFIAIKLNEQAIQALRRAQNQLRQKPGAPAGKWVRPEDIHITLKFLGDVPASDIPQIAEAIEQVCQTLGPLEITLGGLGCFPDTRRPRVVWVGVGGDVPALKRLQQEIEAALEELGYPPEERGFSPHLTLARASRSATPKETAQLGQDVERTPLGEIARVRVERVCLMRSDLRPTGPIYTEQAASTLTGGDAA